MSLGWRNLYRWLGERQKVVGGVVCRMLGYWEQVTTIITGEGMQGNRGGGLLGRGRGEGETIAMGCTRVGGLQNQCRCSF